MIQAKPVVFDPTVAPTPSSAGIDVVSLSVVDVFIGGREDSQRRAFEILVAGSASGDTIGGTVAGETLAAVSVTDGDDEATAADVASDLDALTGISATSTGAVVYGTIDSPDGGGIDLSVTGANGTTITVTADSETCDLYFKVRPAGRGGWGDLPSSSGLQPDYTGFNAAKGSTPRIEGLGSFEAVYIHADNLAGHASDGAVTLRMFCFVQPVT